VKAAERNSFAHDKKDSQQAHQETAKEYNIRDMGVIEREIRWRRKKKSRKVVPKPRRTYYVGREGPIVRCPIGKKKTRGVQPKRGRGIWQKDRLETGKKEGQEDELKSTYSH